jgi:Zn-dependent M28 family amino/carboxypeptidase
LYGFTNNDYDVSRAVPTLIIRNEDYGRITRLMADGIPVEMELQIDSRTHPDGRIMPNVIAEIPGSGKPGELVMLGAHIDSWHLATGATDNAGSAAVMMEAVRILRAIGVQPRRTIRIALWTGEEQGLLGSRAYVQDHFGSFESGARIEFSRLSAYFNVDYGSGRITGLNVFGPPEAAAVLSDILRPFSDDGFQGASPITSRRLVNSDYSSFNAAGLPGISAIQDPRDYLTNTLHTNLDTYERVSEADLRQAAMVIASAVYHLAMRDELLPRFPAGRMPPPNSAAIP